MTDAIAALWSGLRSCPLDFKADYAPFDLAPDVAQSFVVSGVLDIDDAEHHVYTMTPDAIIALEQVLDRHAATIMRDWLAVMEQAR